MERVGTLINKLKEQFDRQDSTEKLAMTAHLILSELQKKQERAPVNRSKVSVVFPPVAANRMPFPEEEASKQVVAEKATVADSNWLFETPVEIPTLAHQAEPIKEMRAAVKHIEIADINKVLSVEAENFNEKLKEERVEVMTALQDSPVRDLKKAIGINDRFLFVNDLFRGDENMYERSIKTINSFSIYPEAQYWIQRELKVKMSWPDNSETVKLFDQLIKRRFS